VQAKDEGHPSDAEVRINIKEAVEKLKTYLKEIEALMSHEGFAYGSKPSWADFFLYPLLADLQTLPEWDEVTSPRIRSWFKKMDELPVAQVTKPGTLSAGARP
jgi:glutathione S-transferase